MPGSNDGGQPWPGFSGNADEFDPRHAAWHHQVSQHGVDRDIGIAQKLERVGPILRGHCVVPEFTELRHDELAHVRIVLHKKKGAAAARLSRLNGRRLGRCMRTVSPRDA
jgi:hypothetical protein